MKVSIVKYNAGNIYSVVNALRRLGVEPLITDDAETLASSDRVLFPGQGEARTTMSYIREHRLDDIIRASKVTARFRHVAERFGKLSLEFDICVPEEMTDSRWQLRFHPQMSLMGESVALDPVLITGSRYRDAQLRGYQRYNAFLASIISDSLAFIYLDQLEFFLRRNFPDTYAMKTDSSVVAEPLAESLFGVTQRQALEHYTKKLLYRRNERRKSRRNRMYEK